MEFPEPNLEKTRWYVLWTKTAYYNQFQKHPKMNRDVIFIEKISQKIELYVN